MEKSDYLTSDFNPTKDTGVITAPLMEDLAPIRPLPNKNLDEKLLKNIECIHVDLYIYVGPCMCIFVYKKFPCNPDSHSLKLGRSL